MHVDVHGVCCVAGGCNAVAILSMAGIVCLVRRNYEQCWVCMVCWDFKLFCKILLLMNVADMDCLLCGRLWREQYVLSTMFI